MKRGRSTGTPTKAQEERFLAIQEFGCIVCAKSGLTRAAEIHHLTIGGLHGQKRRGHDFTIGLCSWHHRGTNAYGSQDMGRATYGPSYALEPRAFREQFGRDEELLKYQDEVITAINAANARALARTLE